MAKVTVESSPVVVVELSFSEALTANSFLEWLGRDDNLIVRDKVSPSEINLAQEIALEIGYALDEIADKELSEDE